MTQQDLADKVSVSRIYIQALESNRRLPSMKLLSRLAEALSVEVSDLVQEPSSEHKGRMQLEELLQTKDVEVWYRSKHLTPNEVQRVKRLIQAALDDWDAEDSQKN